MTNKGFFMKTNTHKTIKIAMTLLIVVILTSLASAQEIPILKEYQEENTYIVRSQKNVDTTINGDLFLVSIESDVQGTINNDLNAISANIRVQGIIGDDLRIIAGEANINAYVFNELRVISGRVTTKETTIINGKTNIIANHADIKGTFNEDVKIKADNAVINALFKENLELEGRNIEIGPDSLIQGNLVVPEGTTLNESLVKGEITYKETIIERVSIRELLMGKIVLFLIIVILAGLLHLVADKKTNNYIEQTSKKPLISLLIGLVSLVALTILTLVGLVSVILAPISALIILGMIALLILTPALGALLIGKQLLELIRPRREIRLEIILGGLFLVILSFIPRFLSIIIFVLYVLFLGTIIRQVLPKRRRTTKKKTKKRRTTRRKK